MNTKYLIDLEDKLIEVCDKCLTASCWHGEFMCDEAQNAGTTLKKISELLVLDREHVSHLSDENLDKIYGNSVEERQEYYNNIGCDGLIV